MIPSDNCYFWIFLILISFSHSEVKEAIASNDHDYKKNETTFVAIIDQILNGYDHRIRPDFHSLDNNKPVGIYVTMHVASLSTISEVNMDYTMELYFRQNWRDKRLSFDRLFHDKESINGTVISVNADVIDKIWRPDTFFANAKSVEFHMATTRNAFLRISSNGQVTYSLRLTVTATCPMDLTYFPMDSQICTLEIESFGFTTKDIIYVWADESSVSLDKNLKLPQYEMIGNPLINSTIQVLTTGNYSRLKVHFHFKRSLGYYLIQIYLPSTLIVVISWVSFWLKPDAVPARVGLGITTILTMTTLISSTNAALPKISYLKSIDVFLVSCFITVFGSLLEFAVVSFVSNEMSFERADQTTLTTPKVNTKLCKQNQSVYSQIVEQTSSGSLQNYPPCIWQRKKDEQDWLQLHEIDSQNISSSSDSPVKYCLNEPDEGVRQQRTMLKDYSRHESGPTMDNASTARKVDQYSRIIFPIAFGFFNIIYWVTYYTVAYGADSKQDPAKLTNT